MSDTSIWAKLAAPLDPRVIKTREERGQILRYIDSRTVTDILDQHALGEWSVKVTPLPPRDEMNRKTGEFIKQVYTMQASLTVHGITREDVGEGDDYKAAASDALKRAAVRFGIGRELYGAKVEGQPVTAGVTAPTAQQRKQPIAAALAPATFAERQSTGMVLTVTGDIPACPKCGEKMWDNRVGKKNPKAPDFKCRDRSCDGVIWPPKPSKGANVGTPATPKESVEEFVERFAEDADSLPF